MGKYMNVKTLFVLAAVPALGAMAANMMGDPDFNGQALPAEVNQFGSPEQGRMSHFEEDLTWNRCVRFEFVTNSVNTKGEVCANAGILFGGKKGRPGFPVTGGKKYRYAFELKGTTPQVIVVQMAWDASGKKLEQKATPMGLVRLTDKDWTPFRGEVEAPENAARLAIALQIWGCGPRYKEVCAPGHYFLADKFLFEEVVRGREIWPSRALVVPEKGSVTVGDFRNFSEVDEPAHYQSRMQVAAEDESLRFSFAFDDGAPVANETEETMAMTSGIWNDDHIELFFKPAVEGGRLVHIAVGAGGARWMSQGDFNLSSWTAEVKSDTNGWRCRVIIPWKTLGYDKRPPKGSVLRFNAMREKVVGRGSSFDPRSATRIGRGVIYDDSLFSYAGREVANEERLGVLLMGEDEKYGDDATAWWYRAERGKEEARLAALEREKFVVAQVPAHTDPNIPYLPPQLFDPQPVFRLRAAVNERAVLSVALVNMTDEMEEYRVTLMAGMAHPSPSYEQPMPLLGLRREDGRVIGMDRITFRRGVRFRDSDSPNHGKRYDILAKMNEVSSLPVAPKEGGLLWVQIDCHGLEPGLYKADLVVTPLSSGTQQRSPKHKTLSNGRKAIQIFDDSKCIPVEFEVLPFALAEPTDMALNGFRTAWSPYQVDFMKKYDFAYYAVTPWFFDIKVNDDGSLAEKTPRSFLLPHLRMLNAEVKKIGDNPRLMVCYAAYPIFKKFHIGKCNPHIVYDTPAYWRAYREWIKYMDETIRSCGFGNDDYVIEVFDEPNGVSNDELSRAFKEAKSAVPKARLLETNGEKRYFDLIFDDVDTWFFSQHVFALKECADMPGRLKAKGGTTSLYACGTQMRQDLYRYYRMLPWKAAAFGGDAVSIFQFFDQVPAACFRQTPDGAIAYDTAAEVVPSIRLENLYQGMTDIRYLRLLKRTAEERKGDPVAAEAIRFAEKTLLELPARYSHDDTKADLFRSKCVDYMLRLIGKKP